MVRRRGARSTAWFTLKHSLVRPPARAKCFRSSTIHSIRRALSSMSTARRGSRSRVSEHGMPATNRWCRIVLFVEVSSRSPTRSPGHGISQHDRIRVADRARRSTPACRAPSSCSPESAAALSGAAPPRSPAAGQRRRPDRRGEREPNRYRSTRNRPARASAAAADCSTARCTASTTSSRRRENLPQLIVDAREEVDNQLTVRGQRASCLGRGVRLLERGRGRVHGRRVGQLGHLRDLHHDMCRVEHAQRGRVAGRNPMAPTVTTRIRRPIRPTTRSRHR